MNSQQTKRIAVFASGRGSNFEALHRACAQGLIHAPGREGTVPARIVMLVCDRPGAPVAEKARSLGVPVLEADPHDYPSKEEYERALLERLLPECPELVCLAGYMRIVGSVLLGAFPRRILNIHPSLLPAFPGAHAMRDALDYGVKVFGPTVHIVDATLDGGPIVAQQAFEYTLGDPDGLEALMHEAEHRLYPKAVNIMLARIAAAEEKMLAQAESERRRREELECEALLTMKMRGGRRRERPAKRKNGITNDI